MSRPIFPEDRKKSKADKINEGRFIFIHHECYKQRTRNPRSGSHCNMKENLQMTERMFVSHTHKLCRTSSYAHSSLKHPTWIWRSTSIWQARLKLFFSPTKTLKQILKMALWYRGRMQPWSQVMNVWCVSNENTFGGKIEIWHKRNIYWNKSQKVTQKWMELEYFKNVN